MKKLLPWIAAVLIAMLTLSALATTSFASEQSANFSGYYVRAVLPENQISRDRSYFDLRMEPSQRQRLELEIVNESSEELTVELAAVSASTNPNGVIDYKTPDVRDETLKIPFSDISTLEESRVTVAPRATAKAYLSIEMPEDAFDGVVLGGIVLTKIDPEQESPPENATISGSASIRNIYSYIIGVKLTESDAVVAPGFELFAVRADAYQYGPAIIHSIRNREAVIVKDLAVTADIYADGTDQPVASIDRSGIDMAPNSVMELALSLDEIGTLKAGGYTSRMTVTSDGETWQFTQPFQVGADQIEQISAETIPTQVTESTPNWIFLVLIAIALLFLLILLVLILILRQSKQKKKEEETLRTVH